MSVPNYSSIFIAFCIAEFSILCYCIKTCVVLYTSFFAWGCHPLILISPLSSFFISSSHTSNRCYDVWSSVFVITQLSKTTLQSVSFPCHSEYRYNRHFFREYVNIDLWPSTHNIATFIYFLMLFSLTYIKPLYLTHCLTKTFHISGAHFDPFTAA